MEEFRNQTEEERRRLEKELLNAANEYALKIQTMEAAQTEKVKKMKEHYEQQIAVCIYYLDCYQGHNEYGENI